MNAGVLYEDFSTPEEDAARKEKLEAEGVLVAGRLALPRSSTRPRAKNSAPMAARRPIRVRMPDDGMRSSGPTSCTAISNSSVPCSTTGSPSRATAFPTYNFACVIDDALMEISHVLRGDDHVSNTPRQIHLYKMLDRRVPKFGHMPMILGPDKKRLSKRHGAASVEEFRYDQWLPEAVVNYLALLGWSPGNDQEFFTVRTDHQEVLAQATQSTRPPSSTTRKRVISTANT